MKNGRTRKERTAIPVSADVFAEFRRYVLGRQRTDPQTSLSELAREAALDWIFEQEKAGIRPAEMTTPTPTTTTK